MTIGKKIQPWKLKMRFDILQSRKIKWQYQNLTELFPQNELSGIDNISNEAGLKNIRIEFKILGKNRDKNSMLR